MRTPTARDLEKARELLTDTPSVEGNEWLLLDSIATEIAVNIFYKVAKNQALTEQFWDEMFEKNKEFIAKYKGEWTKEMHENVYGKRPTEEDQ